jgi:hypothetical protein
MKMTGTLARAAVALVALLAVATMLAGCGRLLQPVEKSFGGPPPAMEAMDYEMAEAPMDAMDSDMARMAAPAGGSVSAAGDTSMALEIMATAEAAENRKVIKTADLNVEVENITSAQKQVQDLVEATGGFIADLEVQVYSATRTDATIVARVPSAKFREAYDAIKQLGDVKRDHVGGQDVTEEYMDLESRIANKQVQENRLREMFAQAKTIEDLLAVEARLTEVRGEIESLQGRLRYLKDRVGFSTITITLYQLGEAPVEEPEGWKIGYHIKGAFNGLLGAIRGLIIALIYILISGAVVWIPLLLIVLWIRRAVRRRHAARMAERTPE